MKVRKDSRLLGVSDHQNVQLKRRDSRHSLEFTRAKLEVRTVVDGLRLSTDD